MKMINRGQKCVLKFLSIFLLTCVVGAGMAEAKTVFEFWGQKDFDFYSDSCIIKLRLTNRHSKTIEYISIDFTLHHKNRVKLGNGSMSFKYVDSYKTESAKDNIDISDDICTLIEYVLIRDVAICKIGGEYYTDCVDFIGKTKIRVRY